MAYKVDDSNTRKQIARFSADEWILFRERLSAIENSAEVSERDKKILNELIVSMKSTAHLAYLARHDKSYSWCKSNQNKPMSVRRIQQILCEHFPEFHIQKTHSNTKSEKEQRIRTEAAKVRRSMETKSNFCGRCGREDVPLDLHHLFPVILGGTNDERNLIFLCEYCHQQQTNYFQERLREIKRGNTNAGT